MKSSHWILLFLTVILAFIGQKLYVIRHEKFHSSGNNAAVAGVRVTFTKDSCTICPMEEKNIADGYYGYRFTDSWRSDLGSLTEFNPRIGVENIPLNGNGSVKVVYQAYSLSRKLDTAVYFDNK